LIQPAVTLQGLEFYIIAGFSILSIPIAIFTGAIIQVIPILIVCMFNFWFYDILKRLHKVIKRENQEMTNERVVVMNI
jgi:hypothetical protein